MKRVLSEARNIELFGPDRYFIGLGVISVRKPGQQDAILNKLVGEGRAVILQEITESGDIIVNASHVLYLVEFVKQVRIRGSKKLISSGVDVTGIANRFDEDCLGSLRRE